MIKVILLIIDFVLLYTVNTDTLKVLGNVHENLELLGGE